MHDLFGRLQTKRRRVIAKRQIAILEHILIFPEVDWNVFYRDIMRLYGDVKNPGKAILRDINHLIMLGAIGFRQDAAGKKKGDKLILWARMEWPTEITETEFFRKVSTLPRVKEQLFVPR